MKIAILGAGNAGCAIAADLSLRKHQVTLIKTSNSIHNENFQYLEENNGKITLFENNEYKQTNISFVTRDLSRITDHDVVIIYIQTNYHEELISKISMYLNEKQIVVFNPGYLSTAYVLKHCKNKNLTIVEAESSFIDCRISEPGLIKVGFRNARNPVAIFPKSNSDFAKMRIEKLGFPITYLDSVIESALHNPNLIVHSVGAIMSIPRIEKTNGDYVMYHEVFTPSVWKILEALDSEKMSVLHKLGFKKTAYVDACKFRNSLDDERDAKEVFFWYALMPTRAKGPTSVNSRYITEDVPQGLVLLESLGVRLNIETPICTSLINLAIAALGIDFRLNGRTIDKLGIENIDMIISDALEIN